MVALVQKLMTEARKNAQIVLVSAHWGTEDSNTVNADQKAAAQLLADNGATMIIGTGPHVEQAVARITASDGRSVPVWYSIGNMLSSQLGINGLTSGVALADIDMNDAQPVVKQLAFAPTFMSYEWSAADKAAQNLLARHNLKLLPLAQSDSQIQTMFGPGYSASERKSYLENVLDASVAQVTVQ
jgi:poly-gamma-glutamate synthesis protein (capsule biosynthesis protein)